MNEKKVMVFDQRISNSLVLPERTNLTFVTGSLIKFIVESIMKVRKGNTILPYSWNT